MGSFLCVRVEICIFVACPCGKPISMQLKAVACLCSETFMLAKGLCEVTTYAKTKSTCDIFRAVERFLIVRLLAFFLTLAEASL